MNRNTLYECLRCGKILKSSWAFKDHTATQHTPSKSIFTCPECSYQVKDTHKSNLRRHLLTKHKYRVKQIKMEEYEEVATQEKDQEVDKKEHEEEEENYEEEEEYQECEESADDGDDVET